MGQSCSIPDTLSHTSPYDNMSLYIHSLMGGDCLPYYVSLPTLIIYSIIFCIGFIGNLITCLVIYQQKLSKATGSNIHIYILSLAVSDLLLLSLGLPFELVDSLSKLYPYRFSEWVCKGRGFLVEFTNFSSVLTITAFSIERWLAICYPMKLRQISKFKRATRVIALCWLLALMCAFPFWPYLIINRLPIPDNLMLPDHVIKKYLVVVGNENFILGTEYCALDARKIFASKVLLTGSFLVFFCLPILMMSFMYIQIMLELRKSTLTDQLRGNCKSNRTGNRRRLQRSLSNTSTRNKAVLRMLVSVGMFFVICWFPFHTQRLLYCYHDLQQLTPFQQTALYLLFMASGCFYYSNSAVNPILYNATNVQYRQAFLRTICCNAFLERYGISRSAQRDKAYTAIAQIREHRHKISLNSTSCVSSPTMVHRNPTSRYTATATRKLTVPYYAICQRLDAPERSNHTNVLLTKQNAITIVNQEVFQKYLSTEVSI